MIKITPTEFYDFRVRYYNGEWPSQRMGQAFVNQYDPKSGEATADLFYTNDPIQAESMIQTRYVDYEAHNVAN